jgi:hypothetical protein
MQFLTGGLTALKSGWNIKLICGVDFICHIILRQYLLWVEESKTRWLSCYLLALKFSRFSILVAKHVIVLSCPQTYACLQLSIPVIIFERISTFTIIKLHQIHSESFSWPPILLPVQFQITCLWEDDMHCLQYTAHASFFWLTLLCYWTENLKY